MILTCEVSLFETTDIAQRVGLLLLMILISSLGSAITLLHFLHLTTSNGS
jgi:hypothetical protein